VGHPVFLRCDATAQTGVGHALRCLALAEGLRDQGWDPRLVGSLTLELVQKHSAAMKIPLDSAPTTTEEFVEDVRAAGATVILDGYLLPAETSHLLREAKVPVAAFSDGPGQWGDVPLVIDQNYGAEATHPPESGQRVLAGTRYAILRDAVLGLRPRTPRTPTGHASRVLVVVGGTDPTGVASLAVSGLFGSGLPLEVTVIAPREELADRLRALQRGPGQVLTVIPPVSDLIQRALEADLVISAAGTTVWELCCVAVPTALICVAENQRAGYTAMTSDGIAVGLGSPSDLRENIGVTSDALRTILLDPDERARLSRAGWEAVDGEGRMRVIGALTDLVTATASSPSQTSVTPAGTPSAHSRREALNMPSTAPVSPNLAPPSSALSVRPASASDSPPIWQWRNDPVTRAASATTEEVAWEDHVSWFERVLASSSRHLLVGEVARERVGIVRFDLLDDEEWKNLVGEFSELSHGEEPPTRFEVSINLAPASRGRGYAAPLLQAGAEWLANTVAEPFLVVARIRVSNTASRRSFARADYHERAQRNQWVAAMLTRP
jgi:spore coat polysaccharide biosynthesis predicted glycosyltransferase SpsG/RimJ/RimL family protein N-acetyltransferase